MKERIWLGLLLAIALIIRFTFFPTNVYFGYDQARDSYASLEILKGHLKIIGPPSSANDNLFHGPLIYYIYSPIYFFSHNNPEAVSFVFRVLNALGLFLVFLISSILFNKKVGLIAAGMFAISFEQSQYSLFLSHPSLAVLTVLIYYSGLALLFFKRDQRGMILALMGLGLSIQFHLVNLFLFFSFFVSILYFRKNLRHLNIKWVVFAAVAFLLSISTFIIAELKFHFREIQALTTIGSTSLNLSTILTSAFLSIKYVVFRLIADNFSSFQPMQLSLTIILIIVAVKLIQVKSLRSKVIFLIIWFITGLIPYGLSGSSSYYFVPATSGCIIILTSFLLSLILKKNFLVAIILILLIAASNLHLIVTQNIKGPNKDFVIQPGMLTVDEKKVLDFCYNKAAGKNFAINALTIPLYINTTWSYLFEWYGEKTYRYLPVWGGKAARGYAGNLKVIDKRSALPDDQCLIIEPTVGISEEDKNNFLREETYFSAVSEQKQYGTIIVQYRKKI